MGGGGGGGEWNFARPYANKTVVISEFIDEQCSTPSKPLGQTDLQGVGVTSQKSTNAFVLVRTRNLQLTWVMLYHIFLVQLN